MRIPLIWDTPRDKISFLTFFVFPCILAVSLLISGCDTRTFDDGRQQESEAIQQKIDKQIEDLKNDPDLDPTVRRIQIITLCEVKLEIAGIRIQEISDELEHKK